MFIQKKNQINQQIHGLYRNLKKLQYDLDNNFNKVYSMFTKTDILKYLKGRAKHAKNNNDQDSLNEIVKLRGIVNSYFEKKDRSTIAAIINNERLSFLHELTKSDCSKEELFNKMFEEWLYDENNENAKNIGVFYDIVETYLNENRNSLNYLNSNKKQIAFLINILNPVSDIANDLHLVINTKFGKEISYIDYLINDIDANLWAKFRYVNCHLYNTHQIAKDYRKEVRKGLN